MIAIIQAIAGAFLRELLGAVSTYLAARQRDAELEALGRARAERDAAMLAAEHAEAMNGVPLPDDAELMKRLRDGSA